MPLTVALSDAGHMAKNDGSSDTDKTTTVSETSSRSTDAQPTTGEATTGEETTVTVTPATEQDYSGSKLVQSGQWNPITHGEPPDLRPKSDF